MECNILLMIHNILLYTGSNAFHMTTAADKCWFKSCADVADLLLKDYSSARIIYYLGNKQKIMFYIMFY